MRDGRQCAGENAEAGLSSLKNDDQATRLDVKDRSHRES